mmetsp:Transcript_19727/g.50077  ORF Transcript_19727/g.50077 Transcript_19727/m.50077 type:complete len:218 (-) Transcript_19727:80-733(-)
MNFNLINHGHHFRPVGLELIKMLFCEIANPYGAGELKGVCSLQCTPCTDSTRTIKGFLMGPTLLLLFFALVFLFLKKRARPMQKNEVNVAKAKSGQTFFQVVRDLLEDVKAGCVNIHSIFPQDGNVWWCIRVSQFCGDKKLAARLARCEFFAKNVTEVTLCPVTPCSVKMPEPASDGCRYRCPCLLWKHSNESRLVCPVSKSATTSNCRYVFATCKL